MLGIGTALALGALSLAGGVGGAAVTGAYNRNSMREANQFSAEQAAIERQFNHDEAVLNRNWNAEQAQLNRDFQENLTNTAYQRAVRDLKAAGLNPYLAYNQGGAAVSSGSQASGQAASGSSARGVSASMPSMSNVVADVVRTYIGYEQYTSALAYQKSMAQLRYDADAAYHAGYAKALSRA